MVELTLRIIEGGRVTIPKDVRDKYGLERGDRIPVELLVENEAETSTYSHAHATDSLR